MSVTGEQRPKSEFKKKVGVFTGEIVAICPDAETLKELKGLEEVGKDLKYAAPAEAKVPTGEIGEDGRFVPEKVMVKGVRLDFYIADTKDGVINKIAFWLKDAPDYGKDGTKRRFINSQGKTSWSDTKENLPKFFTNILDKEGNIVSPLKVREAKVGEEDFIRFIDVWLNINKSKPYELWLDVDKFFDEDFSELHTIHKGTLPQLIMGIYTIKTNTKDGETSLWQNIWKRFLPETYAKTFKMVDYNSEEKQAKLREKQKLVDDKRKMKEKVEKSEWPTYVEKYVLEACNSEFGIKEPYSFKTAHEFNPEESVVASNTPIDTTGNDY